MKKDKIKKINENEDIEVKDIEFHTHELKKETNSSETNKLIISFIVIIIVFLAIVLLFYYLNGKYVKKDEFQDETTTTTTEAIYDDSKINVSNMFNIDKNKYYVLAYDPDDKIDGSFYTSLETSYKGSISLYTLDYSNAMNKKYYDINGKENSNPSKSSDVMFTRPTLILIKKKKVVSYITDKEEIVNILTKKNTTK